MTIEHKVGNLFELLPEIGQKVLIAHVCNNVGGWGSGFVVPLSNFAPLAESFYRQWHREGASKKLIFDDDCASDMVSFELGNVQIVEVDAGVWVANMIAQHSTISRSPGSKPIRYAALIRCMEEVGDFCRENGVEIYCPKFGSDLAGGTWEFIEELIEEVWSEIPVTVCIYE